LRNPGEVILTAGAVRSPHLLLASGVGPAQQLQEYNIPVVSNVPGVGRILKDHLNLKISFSYKAGYVYKTPLIEEWTNFYQGITNQPSFFGSPSSFQIINIFVSSKGNFSNPNLQIEYKPGNIAIFFITLQRVKTSGSVSLQSADPLESPKVALPYPVDPDDVEDIAWGIEFVRELVMASPFNNLIGAEISPSIYDPTGLREWIRQRFTGWIHYSGTCPVGELNSASVVDPFLRVKSISNVRVADGSILIHSGNGNIHNTIMTVALRCSDMILESRNITEFSAVSKSLVS